MESQKRPHRVKALLLILQRRSCAAVRLAPAADLPRFFCPCRVLKVFLSRTAQRVPYMSSLHLLRILAVMLMTVSWFLCAWTVGVLQNRDRNIPVFVRATTSDGQGFNLCYVDRWDYMMAVGA